jgi:two-component system response regulator NreC
MSEGQSNQDVRIVLADDHEMVRAGFRMLIESIGHMTVVAEAADGSQAYALTIREKPDILLIDVSMPPGRSGLAILDEVKASLPDVHVIMLTMFSEPEYLRYSMTHGASGYLLKDASPDELREALETVAAGGTYIAQSLRKSYERMLRAQDEDAAIDAYETLTPREQETMALLAKGFTNKQIAAKLSIAEKTVEAHRSHIYAKMGFKDRAELVEYALQHHIIGASPDASFAG